MNTFDYEDFYEKYYQQEYWGVNRSKLKWFDNYIISKVIKKWIESATGVLVDVGGGVGNWAWYFKDNFDKVIVTDISKVALSRIKEKEIKKINCGVFNIPLKDDSADCILLIDVFEHIEKKDLGKMLQELKRILKKDGRLIIFTSLNGYSINLLPYKLFGKKKPEFEGHLNKLSMKEFRNLFKENQMIIDDYYYSSIFFNNIIITIKEFTSHLVSRLMKKKEVRKGQSIKESIKKKEESPLIKSILFLLSWICYLDVLFLGKLWQGDGIFFKIKKEC